MTSGCLSTQLNCEQAGRMGGAAGEGSSGGVGGECAVSWTFLTQDACRCWPRSRPAMGVESHGPVRGHGGAWVAEDVPPLVKGVRRERQENPRQRWELCRQQVCVARVAGTSMGWDPRRGPRHLQGPRGGLGNGTCEHSQEAGEGYSEGGGLDCWAWGRLRRMGALPGAAPHPHPLFHFLTAHSYLLVFPGQQRALLSQGRAWSWREERQHSQQSAEWAGLWFPGGPLTPIGHLGTLFSLEGGPPPSGLPFLPFPSSFPQSLASPGPAAPCPRHESGPSGRRNCQGTACWDPGASPAPRAPKLTSEVVVGPRVSVGAARCGLGQQGRQGGSLGPVLTLRLGTTARAQGQAQGGGMACTLCRATQVPAPPAAPHLQAPRRLSPAVLSHGTLILRTQLSSPGEGPCLRAVCEESCP